MVEDNQEHVHGHEEEELSRLAYLQNLYSQQYEAMLNELANYSVLQTSLHRSMELLKSKDRVKDANILINVEGGTYLEAKIKSISRVVTYIGANYMVEKDVDAAKAFLAKNLAKIDESTRKLIGNKQRVEDELMRIQYSMELMRHQGQEHV